VVNYSERPLPVTLLHNPHSRRRIKTPCVSVLTCGAEVTLKHKDPVPDAVDLLNLLHPTFSLPLVICTRFRLQERSGDPSFLIISLSFSRSLSLSLSLSLWQRTWWLSVVLKNRRRGPCVASTIDSYCGVNIRNTGENFWARVCMPLRTGVPSR